MPLQATSGAASYDAFGGGVPVVPNYIEEVFSTYLYTGNGSTQSITNGIDLDGKGGLVWMKQRNSDGFHHLNDSTRGFSSSSYSLVTNTTGNGSTYQSDITGVTSTGFTLGYNSGNTNFSGDTYASWTFRKQPKFFDVVTWTGSGANRTIAHNLGSVPGCIFVKRTDTTGNWQVYHRSLANTQYLVLNTTDGVATGATRWNSTTATSTVFSLGTDSTVNASGGTYVAYIFAHDAGGFGLTGTDNVISCGSFTTDGSGNATVNLGYEPQWLLVRRDTGPGSPWWFLFDTMRGLTSTINGDRFLAPHTYNPETSNGAQTINATGFSFVASSASTTCIYIAIRKGPMKVPTSGTSVFNALDLTGTGSTVVRTGAGFTPDLIINRAHAADQTWWADRLRGVKSYLGASNTNAETGSSSGATQDLISFDMDGVTFGSPNYAGFNNSGSLEINWLMKRAPSFFDEVCYTGTGSDITLNHNLTVAPELVILKYRTPNFGAPLNYWLVGSGFTSTTFTRNWLQLTNAGTSFAYTSGAGFPAQPTTTTLTVSSGWSQSATTYVAYLFATCAGVSKVGSYTGNGSTQTINCGFTGGARFVLIKRTDSTGDWYVYDTIRGMSTLTDPYMLLNTTDAESATLGSVTTVSTGFALNSTILAAINVSGGTYIFLAIA